MNNEKIKLVWNESGNLLYLRPEANEIELLDNAVYRLTIDERERLCLVKEYESFEFDYKVYGLEATTINRVIKTYDKTKNNIGVLFNGLKGTGKTVSAKILCNQLKQPVIIITTPYNGTENLLNSIQQNITILIDEYEKIYERSSKMLTIMDGVMNSIHRRAFILTTNELRIDENLMERPSRIRYVKEFSHLNSKIVEEIIDDLLVYPKHKTNLIKFISSLTLITVDIVKSIIQEVNIHNESPEVFEEVFNVTKTEGKFKVIQIINDEEGGEIADNVGVYPPPKYNSSEIGYSFDVDSRRIGDITNVMSNDTLELSLWDYDQNGHRQSSYKGTIIVKIIPVDVIHTSFDGYGTKKYINETFLNDIRKPSIKLESESGNNEAIEMTR